MTNKKIKLLLSAILIIGIIGIAGGCSKNSTSSTQKQVEATTTQTTQKKNNIEALGTTTTTVKGKIYVNMKKTFKGINGMSDSHLLMILPSLSGSGNDIGSHGVAYYTPDEITNESLIEFVKDISSKSNCNYVTLIDINDTSKGIVINTDSTNIMNTVFTKGILKPGFDYAIAKDTSIGFINSKNHDEIDWSSSN